MDLLFLDLAWGAFGGLLGLAFICGFSSGHNK